MVGNKEDGKNPNFIPKNSQKWWEIILYGMKEVSPAVKAFAWIQIYEEQRNHTNGMTDSEKEAT